MDIKKINYDLHKKLYPKKLDNEAWNAMEADDFNPDMIHCYGHDMFDAGADTGAAIGVAAGIVIMGAIQIGKSVVRKIKYKIAVKKLEKSINKFCDELLGGAKES